MELGRVKLLNKEQLIQRLKENGYEQVAIILNTKDIHGDKLLELTEIQTFSWKLTLIQKKTLFSFLNQLKADPSILSKTTKTVTKPTHGLSKEKPISNNQKPVMNQIEKPPRKTFQPKVNDVPGNLVPQCKKPPTANIQSKLNDVPGDQTKADFKKKLGILYGGAGAPDVKVKPVPPFPSSELDAPSLTSSNRANTLPRPGGNIVRKESFSDGPTEQVSTRAAPNKITENKPKPAFPLPVEPKSPSRSPFTGRLSNVNVDSEANISNLSTEKITSSRASRKPALPLPKKPIRLKTEPENFPATPVSNNVNQEGDEGYMDMRNCNKINSLHPKVSDPRNKVPSKDPSPNIIRPALTPRNISPNPVIDIHTDDDTYEDPREAEQVYEAPPDLNFSKAAKFTLPPNLPSTRKQTKRTPSHSPSRVTSDSSDDARYNVGRKRSTAGQQDDNHSKRNYNLDVVDEKMEKPTNGFLGIKKLFGYIRKDGYENVVIGQNLKRGDSVSEKLIPRPLPPIPSDHPQPKIKAILPTEPLGYLEQTQHPPDPTFYRNADETLIQTDEYEEANYSNVPEVSANHYPFTRPVVANLPLMDRTKKLIPRELSKNPPKASDQRNSPNKFELNYGDSNSGHSINDGFEDGEDAEQTYSNLDSQNSRTIATNFAKLPKPLAERNNPSVYTESDDTEDNEEQTYLNLDNKNSKATNFARLPIQTTQPHAIEEDDMENDEGVFYGNVERDRKTDWRTRPLPELPIPTNGTVIPKDEARSKYDTFVPQAVETSSAQKGRVENEIQEEAGQIYGNIDESDIQQPSHSVRSNNSSRVKGNRATSGKTIDISNESYYRYTDRKGAKQLLGNLAEGAFLFRPSDKYYLVLTTKHNKKCYNFGILKTEEGKIRLNAHQGSEPPEFNTMQEFADYFSREPLTFVEGESLTEMYLNPVLPHNVF
ncbi:hypothetical protein JTB14_000163 [Gonioctena quinquepunctata]|nr:hypothetical protein JTB14_000163 [Gonioctena quinquepunctata]